MSANPVALLSPEEYLALERAAEFKSEYFNGRVYAMSGGSRAHSAIAINLARAFSLALDHTPCLVFSSDLRLRVPETGLYTYPDLSVVCSEPEFADDYVDTLLNPIVVVEVLSKSTEAHDRGLKFINYRKLASLQEYVLIAQAEPRVEVFRRRGPGEWALSESGGQGAICRLESIGAEIALADIYRKVAFATV